MAEATVLRPAKDATSTPGSTVPSNTDDIEHILREQDQEEDLGELQAGNRLSELPELPSSLKNTPGEKMAERPEMQPRRSVQFARLPVDGQLDGLQEESTAHADENANGSANGHAKPVAATDSKASRTSALLSRIKIRPPTTPKFERSPIDFAASSPGERLDPGQSSNEYATPAETPRGFTSEDEEDADAEGSEDEEGPSRLNALQRLKKKTKRPQGGGESTPNSPMFRPSFFTSFSQQAGELQTRPGFMRRATTTDVEPEGRLGVSEDEGRSRLARKSSSPWMRGKRIMHRRSSSNQLQADDSSRPGAFRRALTTFAPSQTPTEPMSPSPWRVRRDQTMSAGAARWKQIKASLKTIGRAKKLENPMDTIKSAELISELTAGAPAALMIASIFQRDEGGSKKIPILLEQLKVKLTNSQAIIGKSGDRHLTFRIDLEYGSGLTRMNWSIERTLRDFYYLHLKYWKYRNPVKTRRYVQPEGDDARSKLPHFPRDVVPYLRGVRGFDASSLNVAELEAEETGGASTEENNNAQRPKKRRQGSIGGLLRRQSSLTGDESQGEGLRGSGMRQKESWPERSRRKLDEYLQQLIRYLTFRPGTNRLCKFLELSALGVRLAAEGSYHGKEGRMTIISGKGIDFRRKLKPGLFKDRHSPKWFMVRHSYVVCTESPQDVDIYDVFLVDSDFKLQAKEKLRSTTEPEESVVGPDGRYKSSRRGTGSHHLTLYNSERKVKLAAKNARQLAQFVQSIRAMAHNTPWGKVNRFNSFAPVRRNVFAQWLVDGRDYMWNVSRAISMAKDVIYIHDWWLSPELYLRRPAAIAQKWRLDRLLQAKAREGVKVFVIMYRNVESAIPIDSAYSKLALLDLHPNIFVQRSPNQLRQNTFFWAHHEKICIVDHIIAFVGGIDLCFGRWDTPQHLLADDKPTGFEDLETPKNADNAQLWPGKDYSNPRVQDFYALDKPYEEMYDRSRVPRMPWHDIHMQVVGQPARDLTRHFVQRWNFILRSRVPSRPTPFLLPPPDFVPGELESLGLDGTCEVQILRSCTEWSIGTPGKTEHSIMDAYCTTISQSEHFIYIENQFYISRCEVNGVKIENSISDAIVERILRAYTNDEKWRAVIVIPLMPGFQNTVDAQDGTSVRLIMQCQYRSICRGEESIFGRLRAAGIEPEDYIQFYSLRTWGKIGPSQALTTEQLYIHAKCMIVDDRVAIIASANINERSQRGDRDSECGAVVRDTDTLWSTMAGQPYRVGRFPHTLRMRLMREHLGIDVDALEEGNGQSASEEEATPKKTSRKLRKKRAGQSEAHPPTASAPTAMDGIARGVRVTGNTGLDSDLSTEEEARPDSKGKQRPRTADSRSRAPTNHGRRASHGQEPARPAPVPLPRLPRMTTHELGLPQLSTLPALPVSDDTDIGGPGVHKLLSSQTAAQAFPVLSKMRRPEILTDCMKDPLNDDFYDLIWHAVAENNTALYRAVFRCQPDSEVVSWKDYHDYMNYSDRFSQSQGAGKSTDRQAQEAKGQTGPPGAGSIKEKASLDPLANRSIKEEEKAHGRHDGSLDEKAPSTRGSNGRPADGLGSLGSGGDGRLREKVSFEPGTNTTADGRFFDADNEKVSFPSFVDGSATANGGNLSEDHHVNGKDSGEQHQQPNGQPAATKIHLQLPTESNVSTSGSKRSRRNTTRGRRRTLNNSTGEIMAKEDAEELLKMIQGHLVVWPYDWLVKEDEGGNWLYHIDQLAPLEIYD